MTILIGIPACVRTLGHHLQHATPSRYAAAVLGGSGGIPVMIPPMGEAALPVLERLDGLLLPGSPSNVEPALYGAADETPELHDTARDSTTLPLLREALRRDMPVLAICRGIQELNVALGGSLHQRVYQMPGRGDHWQRGGGPAEEVYAPRHPVTLSGRLAAMLGATRIDVNSIHGQAIDRLAAGLEAEGVADDGLVEAVRVTGVRFGHAVQWHPEWNYAADPNSVRLFAAFGAACRAFGAGLRRAA